MENIKKRIRNMEPDERRRFLQNNADEVKNESNYVDLSEEKVRELESRFMEESIELNKMQEEYEEVKRRWKEEEINPRKERCQTILEQVQTGVKEFQGRTYYIRDFEDERVYKFLEDGTLVDARPMWESEKQATVHNIGQKNTGTANQN